MKMCSFVRTFWRIISRKKTGYFIVMLAVITILMVMINKSARNWILYPVWPMSLRTLSNTEVFKILFLTDVPANVTNNTACLWHVSPSKDLNISVGNAIFSLKTRAVLSAQDTLFLPQLLEVEKKQLLYLYRLVNKSLSEANIEFYFMSGSLIGVYRHHGLVPWDDDIDISIDVDNWQSVRSVLACIKGHTLQINPNMHWKFFQTGRHFPFIDIFFMACNEHYTWPVVHYFRSEVLPKKHIRPLKLGIFEDMEVPIPFDTAAVLETFIDVQYCRSPSIWHKNHVTHSQIVTVPCADLHHMYTMYI